MLLLKRTFPLVLTIAIGWLVLISYLPSLGSQSIQLGGNSPFTLSGLRARLVEGAVVLAAVALVLGYINLLRVHTRRILQRQSLVYSLFLVISSVLTLGLWIGSVILALQAGLREGLPLRDALNDALQSSTFLDVAFSWIILPIQSALGALLAILIAVAGFRALRTRRSVGMALFVLAAVFVLLTQPVSFTLFGAAVGNVLELFRSGVIDPITTGGIRGLLLGVALGSIVVGLRLLVGVDKPQSD